MVSVPNPETGLVSRSYWSVRWPDGRVVVIVAAERHRLPEAVVRASRRIWPESLPPGGTDGERMLRLEDYLVQQEGCQISQGVAFELL